MSTKSYTHRSIVGVNKQIKLQDLNTANLKYFDYVAVNNDVLLATDGGYNRAFSSNITNAKLATSSSPSRAYKYGVKGYFDKLNSIDGNFNPSDLLSYGHFFIFKAAPGKLISCYEDGLGHQLLDLSVTINNNYYALNFNTTGASSYWLYVTEPQLPLSDNLISMYFTYYNSTYDAPPTVFIGGRYIPVATDVMEGLGPLSPNACDFLGGYTSWIFYGMLKTTVSADNVGRFLTSNPEQIFKNPRNIRLFTGGGSPPASADVWRPHSMGFRQPF